MIAHGAEFKTAEFIALILVTPTLIYMISVCRVDSRWIKVTIAVFFLFLSTIFAFLREFYLFDTFRMLEWIFILLTAATFAFAVYSSNKSIRIMQGEQ